MKSKKNLVFLGMMGSGKSTIGYMLSKKIKMDFVDVDKEIETEVGMKISEIFEIKGEIFFRNIEEKLTLDILKKSDCIISLGGGAFLNKKIQNEVLDNHLSIWLNWKTNTLIQRIINNKKRPIAFKASKNYLKEIIKKRSNIYSKALHKIDCDKLTKRNIIDKILYIYENN